MNFFSRQFFKLKYHLYKICGVSQLKVHYPWGIYFVGFDWTGTNIYFKNYENAEASHFANFINENAIIFDVGANIGFYSVLFGNIAKAGKVYSFEPSHREFDLLKKNISANKLRNVYPYKIALGDRNGNEWLYLNNSNFGANTLHQELAESPHQREKVEVLTVDQIADLNKLTRIDFLKIDVEGHELNVLLGASAVISRFRPVIFFESWKSYQNNFASALSVEIDFLTSHGYEFFIVNSDGPVKLLEGTYISAKDILAIPILKKLTND